MNTQSNIKRLENGRIDLNWLASQDLLSVNGLSIKLELIRMAETELFNAVKKNYYDVDDLKSINYSEVCDWCGFPDFQDGGIFEQSIDTAANTILNVLGYKPTHFID